MSQPTHPAAGHSLADLKELIKQDHERSQDIQARITQLRQDIKDGKKLPKKKIDLMEVSNKDMVKDLITRIEQIESTNMTATDREMLQALNSRLAVCDQQAMRLAELRELEREARGEQNDFLEPESEPSFSRSKSAPIVPTHDAEHAEELAMKTSTSHESLQAPTEDAGHISDGDIDYALAEHHLDEASNMTWALPYKVLHIHPETPDSDMAEKVKEAVAALAAKHDPKRVPNDPEAVERWAVIEKSREVLIDAEKRRFMDTHDKLPADLEGLDLAKLSLE